ncbi:MAG TPA: DegT/DnrJ/EryC1/StrS family aminotransferase [Chryseosolibacter sp.]
MMQIKMVDLHGQYLRIKEEVDEAMRQVLDSTAFIQGPQVGEFAKRLSAYIGGSHVIPCANGTDALQIAMMALDFKQGDEIILPVHTYVATAEVIALLKLTPVFVDVNPESFTIDTSVIETKITARTKAIVPVHLYGQCCDMENIIAIAQRHNLHVIEDAAQALGAAYHFADNTKKQAGTMGVIGTTSFFPSKNLGCFGDGGAIFTQSDAFAEKIKMIANHGQLEKYHHDLVGVNSRLDTLQAAVLNVKLKYLNEYTKTRNWVAEQYDKRLSTVSGVSIPVRVPYSTHVFHQYTLKVDDRDNLRKYLDKQGIPTMVYYPVPLHLQKAYRDSSCPEQSFPITEMLSKTVLSLPIHTEMREDEIHYVCDAIKKFYGES